MIQSHNVVIVTSHFLTAQALPLSLIVPLHFPVYASSTVCSGNLTLSYNEKPESISTQSITRL